MKTTQLHIFEFQQKIQDSPHDQSLRARFENHITECAECRKNLILFRELQSASQDKPIATQEYKFSNPLLISNVKKQTQDKRFIPNLLRPLSGFAWIIMTVLIVVLMSWGISRLRTDSNRMPATIMQPYLPTNTPATISQDLKTCRTIVYTVEEKNTLLAIADYFNVAISDIWKENNLGNNTALKPGIRLLIPFCGWSPILYTYDLSLVTPINNCPVILYTVQQGETLEMLSIFFNVPESTIIKDNQLENSTVFLTR